MTEPQPKTWVDAIRQFALKEWVLPRLQEHFPNGVPGEVLDAVTRDVSSIFDGKPLHWWHLRRTVLSVTNETLAKLSGTP